MTSWPSIVLVHQVFLERAAERDLRALPLADFHRIVGHIRAPAKVPRPHGCRKIAGSAADWRIRVGVYRVIYEVDDKSAVVRIMRVRHRRESYR